VTESGREGVCWLACCLGVWESGSLGVWESEPGWTGLRTEQRLANISLRASQAKLKESAGAAIEVTRLRGYVVATCITTITSLEIGL